MDAPSATVDSSFASAPPLAGFGTAAAIASVAAQLAVRGQVVSEDHFLHLHRASLFAANLSAVCGLVVIGYALTLFASTKGFRLLALRSSIAFFGACALATLCVAVVTPAVHLDAGFVLIASGFVHGAILLVTIAGLHRHTSFWLGLSLFLYCAAFVLALTGSIVLIFGQFGDWGLSQRVGGAFIDAGEVLYMLAPFAAAVYLLRPWATAPKRIIAGTALACATIGFANVHTGDSADTLLYAAFRLGLLGKSPASYAWILAPIGAVGFAGWLSHTDKTRQAGLAVMLLLVAGYAPRSPWGLLIAFSGVCLLARAAVAESLTRLSPNTAP